MNDIAEVVETLSPDECRPTCWCRLETHDKPERVMRWTPDYAAEDQWREAS